MDPYSAKNVNFYAPIDTKGTADTADDVVVYPTSAVYTPYDLATGKGRMVTLTFATGIDSNGNAFPITDLAQLGTGAFRLRVGDQYQTVSPVAGGGLGGDIVTTDVSSKVSADIDHKQNRELHFKN